MGVQGVYRFWQAVLCILHYTAATLVLYYTRSDDGAWGAGWELPVVVRYNIWTSSNGECDADQGCTIREYEQTLDHTLATGGLVASFSYISGTHHLIVALFTSWYVNKVAKSKGVSALRWVDYAWSASLMLMLDSALWLAPPTAQQLILTFSAMFLTITAGYGSEVAWSGKAYGHANFIFFMALAGFTAVWGSTFLVFAQSRDPASDARPLKGFYGREAPEPGASKPPDFVIIILAFLFGSYCLFPAAALYRLTCKTPSKKVGPVIRMESIYSFLSFFAKIPLLAVYGTAIGGRSGRITIDGLTNDTSAVGEDESGMSPAVTALIASVCGSITLGIVMAIHISCAGKGDGYEKVNSNDKN